MQSMYLAGVHRCWSECRLAQCDCGSQQVTGFSLILTVFQLQLFSWQHRFIAWRITWGWEELKLPMTTPEEKSYPAVRPVTSREG